MSTSYKQSKRTTGDRLSVSLPFALMAKIDILSRGEQTTRQDWIERCLRENVSRSNFETREATYRAVCKIAADELRPSISREDFWRNNGWIHNE